MDDAPPSAAITLVPGRECGSCDVCCVSLIIDDPALQKANGVRCHNLRAGGGCTIYHDRPATCRTFYCGWRQLKWVREALRPDRSHVLVGGHQVAEPGGKMTDGVLFTLLSPEAIKAEGLAESVAAAVAANVPAYVNVPGPPGRATSIIRVNRSLAGPVASKDKKAILRILRRLRSEGAARSADAPERVPVSR